jgi:hypothetical protein
MKKIVLLGIAATALLTACSNDDVVEVKTTSAIGFNTFVNNATRTVTGEVTKANIDEFAVWGFTTPSGGSATQIFNAEAVTRAKDGETWGDWDYKNTQYWVSGNAYTFSAISPVPTSSNGISYAIGTGVPSGTISFTQDELAQRDLVYAYATATGKASDNAVVGFNFNHLLSRVALKVTNSSTNAQNTVLVISNVKLKGALASGDFVTTNYTSTSAYDISGDTFKGFTWSNLGSANKDIYLGTKDVTYPNTATGNVTVATSTYGVKPSSTTQSGWSYIIPIEDSSSTAKYTITFDVEVYQAVSDEAGATGVSYIRYPQDSSSKYSVSIETTAAQAQMLKGYSYIYSVELNVLNDLSTTDNPIEPIKFTVSEIASFGSTDDIVIPDSSSNTDDDSEQTNNGEEGGQGGQES